MRRYKKKNKTPYPRYSKKYKGEKNYYHFPLPGNRGDLNAGNGDKLPGWLSAEAKTKTWIHPVQRGLSHYFIRETQFLSGSEVRTLNLSVEKFTSQAGAQAAIDAGAYRWQ